MKAAKAHAVPLSDPAISILRGQHKTRGKNPHMFPGDVTLTSAGRNSTDAVNFRRLRP